MKGQGIFTGLSNHFNGERCFWSVFFQRPKAAPKMPLAGLSVKGSIEMHGERFNIFNAKTLQCERGLKGSNI